MIGLENLDQSKDECERLLACLKKFGFNNEDSNKIYDLSNDPTKEHFQQNLNELK